MVKFLDPDQFLSTSLRDYVRSHTIEKGLAQCSNIMSVYETFHVPGKIVDIEKLFCMVQLPVAQLQ